MASLILLHGKKILSGRGIKTHLGSRDIVSLIINLGTRWRSDQVHALAALPPGNNPKSIEYEAGLDVLEKKYFFP